jgi:BlaI family transcriptional regulator, penicillinase repressor
MQFAADGSGYLGSNRARRRGGRLAFNYKISYFIGVGESKRGEGSSPVPRKTSETLTEAELRIMQVLWLRESGTVQQILDGLPDKPPLAYNTVLTTIRILEKKGYVGHDKDGRAHIFRPIVERDEASRSEIRHLVGRFFRNSHEDLVLNILEDRGIDPRELARLRKMLEESGSTKTLSGDGAQ